jgi:hypothetical protein
VIDRFFETVPNQRRNYTPDFPIGKVVTIIDETRSESGIVVANRGRLNYRLSGLHKEEAQGVDGAQ